MSVYNYSIYDYLSNIPDSTTDALTENTSTKLSEYLDSSSSGSNSSTPNTGSYNVTAGQLLSNYAPSALSMLGNVMTGNVLGAAMNVYSMATQDPYAAPGWVGQTLDSWLNDYGPTYYGDIYQKETWGPSMGIDQESLDYGGWGGQYSGTDVGSYGGSWGSDVSSIASDLGFSPASYSGLDSLGWGGSDS